MLDEFCNGMLRITRLAYCFCSFLLHKYLVFGQFISRMLCSKHKV